MAVIMKVTINKRSNILNINWGNQEIVHFFCKFAD